MRRSCQPALVEVRGPPGPSLETPSAERRRRAGGYFAPRQVSRLLRSSLAPEHLNHRATRCPRGPPGPHRWLRREGRQARASKPRQPNDGAGPEAASPLARFRDSSARPSLRSTSTTEQPGVLEGRPDLLADGDADVAGEVVVVAPDDGAVQDGQAERGVGAGEGVDVDGGDVVTGGGDGVVEAVDGRLLQRRYDDAVAEGLRAGQAVER